MTKYDVLRDARRDESRLYGGAKIVLNPCNFLNPISIKKYPLSISTKKAA
jgi:hypothetical protein